MSLTLNERVKLKGVWESTELREYSFMSSKAVGKVEMLWASPKVLSNR